MQSHQPSRSLQRQVGVWTWASGVGSSSSASPRRFRVGISNEIGGLIEVASDATRGYLAARGHAHDSIAAWPAVGFTVIRVPVCCEKRPRRSYGDFSRRCENIEHREPRGLWASTFQALILLYAYSPGMRLKVKAYCHRTAGGSR